LRPARVVAAQKSRGVGRARALRAAADATSLKAVGAPLRWRRARSGVRSRLWSPRSRPAAATAADAEEAAPYAEQQQQQQQQQQ
jgi:hypothetical protein